MAIPNRELQLSQDLMELQSRYNELNRNFASVLKDARDFRVLYDALKEEILTMQQLLELTKETQPSVAKIAPKKKTRKTV